MTQRTSRWILWIALVVLVPAPFFLVETGAVPVARLLMLGGVLLAVIVTEGSQGMVGIGAGLLLGQAAVYLALFWVAAHLLSAAISRGSARRTAAVTLLAVAVGLLLATSFEIYQTPFRTRSLRGSLLDMVE